MAELTLAQALAELPDTADGIAAFLADLKCTGKRNRTDCCPIANYLKQAGVASDLDVDPLIVTVWPHNEDTVDVRTPEHVAEFMRRFDGWAWPELVQAADDA